MTPGGATSRRSCDAAMSAMAERRLGDVVRVVAGLGELSSEQHALVADLLPSARGQQPVGAVPQGLEPAITMRGVSGATEGQLVLRDVPAAAPVGPPATTSRQRRAARRRRRAERAAAILARVEALLSAGGARALAIVLAPLAVGAAALQSPLPAWPGVVALGVGAAIGVALGASRLASRCNSPLRHSTLRQQAAAADSRPRLTVGSSIELTHTRWRRPPLAEPLVAPPRGRAFAIGLAAVDVPGPIDVRRLVEAVARRRLRRQPPRITRRSMRRGVQLLVDRGPALDPLRDDIARLIGWLVDVASDSGLQRLGFDGDPRFVVGAGGGRDPDELVEHRLLLPPSGGAVVVVCDLGIARPRSGRHAPPAIWRAHERLVRDGGCRPVYLVPYPPDRWPSELARRLAIVHWCEAARPDQVLYAVGRG